MSVYISPVPVPAPILMQLSLHRPSPSLIVLTVTGEVDMATAPALYAALTAALSGQAPTVVRIDLAGCTFLDCSGIRVLVAAVAVARTTGCRIWATSPRRIVRRVLEFADLTDLLHAPGDAPQPASSGSMVDAAWAPSRTARHPLVSSEWPTRADRDLPPSHTPLQHGRGGIMPPSWQAMRATAQTPSISSNWHESAS